VHVVDFSECAKIHLDGSLDDGAHWRRDGAVDAAAQAVTGVKIMAALRRPPADALNATLACHP